MKRMAWWLGALVELLVTPWRENNPLLGVFVALALTVEIWVIALMVTG